MRLNLLKLCTEYCRYFWDTMLICYKLNVGISDGDTSMIVR